METLYYEIKPIAFGLMSYYAMTAASVDPTLGRLSGLLLAFCTILILHARIKHRGTAKQK